MSLVQCESGRRRPRVKPVSVRCAALFKAHQYRGGIIVPYCKKRLMGGTTSYVPKTSVLCSGAT